MVQLSHPCMTTGKTALTVWTSVSKMMSLIFNTLSTFVIAFLPRSKCLFILWLQSPSAEILKPKKTNLSLLPLFPLLLPQGYGNRCHNLSFWMLSFKPAFSLLSFIPIKRLFSSSSLSFLSLEWHHLCILGCWYFSQQSSLPFVIHPVWHFTWCTLNIS